MCRWNSGFFYAHPALASYTHYWRVEPDVHFFCHLPYDPFAFLHANDMVYGFNMAILEDARSFPSLWSVAMDFVARWPDRVHPDADLSWLYASSPPPSPAGADNNIASSPSSPSSQRINAQDAQQAGYNACQFFSNFEIGSLEFFRSAANTQFFKHLDDSGGFYYERFGDAPVHTLAVSLFARPDQVWFFEDVGYQHDATRHCPRFRPRFGGGKAARGRGRRGSRAGATGSNGGRGRERGWGVQQGRRGELVEDQQQLEEGWGGERCACEPTGLDRNFYMLVPMESPQRKSEDTCIRLWLGGRWREKVRGWRADVERLVGGDGFGGYVWD
jgi:hypothetical protein